MSAPQKSYPLRSLARQAIAGDQAALVEFPECVKAILELSRDKPNYENVYAAIRGLIDHIMSAYR